MCIFQILEPPTVKSVPIQIYKYLVDVALTVWMGLCQFCTFGHCSFFANCSSSVRLHEDPEWSLFFMSTHKFSIEVWTLTWLLQGINVVFKPFLQLWLCAWVYCLAGKQIFSLVAGVLQGFLQNSPLLLHLLDPHKPSRV